MSDNYRAAFHCVRGCAGSYPLDRVIYRCPRCAGLLEVVHDLAPLRARSGADWRALFDARANIARWDGPSGVWAKKEWVAPHIRAEHVVSLAEGGTPLVPTRTYGAAHGVPDVFIKQCGSSHTGSFKDLGMTVLVSAVKQMIADGADIPAIACASTGDTSAALAAYAAAAGIRAVVILPRGKISTAQLVQPLASGALVLALDTDFDGCMRLVVELAEREGVYLANSMNSLRLEGQKTVAVEIVQQLGWQAPDWVIIPGGNLGNVSALGAGFAMMRALGVVDDSPDGAERAVRLPRICVAQAAHANPLYESYQRGFDALRPMTAKTTAASAIQIGDPVSYEKAVRALIACDGVVEQASEAALADAAAHADRTGMFACPHTGVALAAFESLAARGDIAAGDRVVIISTASGLKFSGVKASYHDAVLAEVPAPRHRNTPVDLPPRYDAVRDALQRGLAC